jgi:hypothetical protein
MPASVAHVAAKKLCAMIAVCLIRPSVMKKLYQGLRPNRFRTLTRVRCISRVRRIVSIPTQIRTIAAVPSAMRNNAWSRASVLLSRGSWKLYASPSGWAQRAGRDRGDREMGPVSRGTYVVDSCSSSSSCAISKAIPRLSVSSCCHRFFALSTAGGSALGSPSRER